MFKAALIVCLLSCIIGVGAGVILERFLGRRRSASEPQRQADRRMAA
jgi:cation transporter-like permease